jgi:hypothetical protein
MAFLEIVGAAALGGAISYGTTRAFEKRREHRADDRERAAIKAAARIAYTDMGRIRRNLRESLTNMYWAASVSMPTSGWQQQGDKLAGALEPRDYEAVANVFARAGDLERTFQSLLAPDSTRRGRTREGMPAVALDEDDLAPVIRGALMQAEAARGILAALAFEGEDLPSNTETDPVDGEDGA